MPRINVLHHGIPTIQVKVGSSSIRIGRSEHCDLRINDAAVSRDHALIVVGEDGRYLIRDLSRHGTWVNGEQVLGDHVLTHGDRIDLGKHYALVFNRDQGGLHTESRVETSEIPLPAGTHGMVLEEETDACILGLEQVTQQL